MEQNQCWPFAIVPCLERLGWKPGNQTVICQHGHQYSHIEPQSELYGYWTDRIAEEHRRHGVERAE